MFLKIHMFDKLVTNQNASLVTGLSQVFRNVTGLSHDSELAVLVHKQISILEDAISH